VLNKRTNPVMNRSLVFHHVNNHNANRITKILQQTQQKCTEIYIYFIVTMSLEDPNMNFLVLQVLQVSYHWLRASDNACRRLTGH